MALINEIRGKRVMIDRDLAECFGVETKRMNEQVRRNGELFTPDVMFKICKDDPSWSQLATMKDGRGRNLKYEPNAFTEEGVRALAQVLKRQVDVNFEPEITEPESIEESWNKGTVLLYRGENGTNLEVQVMDETVWLTQEQLSILLGSTPQNITTHIRNIYEEGELDFTATCKDYLQVRFEGSRSVSRTLKIYNLDVIISVGYRVKSVQGTRFRQWANRVLKDYLIKGYSINWRLHEFKRSHDRFLCIDDTVYHIGASLKDLGKKWFAFNRMELKTDELLSHISPSQL